MGQPSGVGASEVLGEYGDVFLMVDYGWTWQQVQEIPLDVMKRLQTYRYVQGKKSRG